MALLKRLKSKILKVSFQGKIIKRFRDLARYLYTSEVKSRLTSALLWGSTATLLGRGLPLLAMILTARSIGPEAFGKLSLLYSTALAFEIFVTAGLSVTCTKLIADLYRTDKVRTGKIIDLANLMSIILALLIGAVLIMFAPTIAQDVFRVPDLTNGLYGCSILVALISFSGIQQGVLTGLEKFRTIAVIELVGGMAFLISMPLLGAFFGFHGALGGLIISNGLRLIVQFYAVWKQMVNMNIKRRWIFPKTEIVILWMFSLPSMLNSFIFGFVTWIAMAIIAREPNGPVEVGIFSAAYQWFSLLLFLPTILNQVLFPIITERLNAGDWLLAWRLFYGKVILSMIVVTVASVAIGVMSPLIMTFYGSVYSEKWPLFLVVLLAAWISAPLGPMGNFMSAHGNQWGNFGANVGWGVSLIVVVLVLRDYGTYSLAWAYVAAYSVKSILLVLRIASLHPAGIEIYH